MAVMLTALSFKFFQDQKFENPFSVATISTQSEGKTLTFAVDDFRKPLEVKDLYELFIFSLFILSLILPLFVSVRSVPIERTEIKLNE